MVENVNYLALRAQQSLERRIATAANNLANAGVNGFKADDVRFEAVAQRPARAVDRPRDIVFVRDVGLIRDFRQGPLQRTGESFDVALEGEGFFVVQGDSGPLYTRDGAFRLNAEGGLVTRDGRAVLNTENQPIVFDPRGEPPQIDAQGRIRVGAAQVGALQVAAFADQTQLAKLGDSLFDAAGRADPQPSQASVVQGSLENSNVSPILELTELIQVSRAYQGAAQIVADTDNLRRSALERLSGVA
jgi:flagellar basal-body rod protein FlgF